jgi:RimJ/RimL family protein N-acetyltransferase
VPDSPDTTSSPDTSSPATSSATTSFPAASTATPVPPWSTQQPVELRTDRLLLRPWRAEDREPFAALNDDPAVMEHFPEHLTREASDAMADRIEEALAQHGWGLWAAEVVQTGEFIGFVGLSIPRFDEHFTPCVEIGWRLARSAWGRGYAPEGARAALAHAFGPLGLTEVVAMTIPANDRSRSVMRKIGMVHDGSADFDHPLIPEGDPARRHVLYRIERQHWISQQALTTGA